MTHTDTQFANRFPDMTTGGFNGNQSTLGTFVPTSNTINTGMLSDIARATIYAPDIQESFYSRFMRAPLQRGDAMMKARFEEITSAPFDPNAAQSVLFSGSRPGMISNVAKKNLSRQIKLEVNDYWIKQFVQTPEMIGDAQAAIVATMNACFRDDMWVAAKEYFSGDMRSAQATQSHIMTNGITDAGFADELVENIWKKVQNQFKYKSTAYNASAYNTKSRGVHIALKKDIEFPGFKKLYADTFNPEFIKVTQTIDYVDDFATPAGAPAGAGELIGMIVDDRAFDITPMPDGFSTESFRNAARKSTTYFQTYEMAFSDASFFNKAYIFAKP